MASMDELRDQISIALLKLNNSDLVPVCKYLKCDEPVGGLENKTRCALIRLVEKTLDSIEETEDKEVFLQCLENLRSLIDSVIQSTETASNIPPDEPNELDMLKEKYTRLQMEQAQARQTLEEEIVAMEQQVHSDVSENEDFQNGELVLQFPTSLSQCQNPACLNPEAEPFTPSVEQHREREPKRTEEDIAEEVLEERREADLGMPAVQSEISEEQASVESENDDSLPVNSYPRRERRRPRILTYDSLGQPSVVEVVMDRLSVSTETSVQRMWRPWTVLEITG
ncbi:hypothetical protein G5714_007516 [Onychostoma macrolepis]|uniref:Uncharacterized protein n=1 Tax=Onychostoma macrolepis TaxID=369639 RepID=A0A7J6CVB0_9TELE|nr:hypothetical protein G5714_007516 [Onychostoma macrolepis]